MGRDLGKWLLSFDQTIMAALTLMIVVASATQAFVSVRQTALLEAASDREIARDSARVKIAFNGDADREGFSCVNAGYRDVVISDACLWRDPPPGTYESRMLIDSADPSAPLPIRLRPGESVTFLEREERLIEATKDERLQPVCRDTFGNTHAFEAWVVSQQDATSVHGEPGPGWTDMKGGQE